MEIIIVDDDLVSQTVLKQLVEKLPDCDARGFSEAHPALAWCSQNDPDLIIVDHMMPELDGIEFTRRLRALEGKRDTPVLMVTSSDVCEVRDNALRSGVNDFLNKPFDFADLQPRAVNMLALRASQKRAQEERVAARRKSILDANITLERLAGDETLLADVASVFMRTAPELVTHIGEALRRNDLKHAFVQAHALKGAVAAFEAPEVFNAVLNVERYARSDEAAHAAAAYVIAQELVDRLVSELLPFLPRNKAAEAQA